jgi:hypothetical protein
MSEFDQTPEEPIAAPEPTEAAPAPEATEFQFQTPPAPEYQAPPVFEQAPPQYTAPEQAPPQYAAPEQAPPQYAAPEQTPPPYQQAPPQFEQAPPQYQQVPPQFEQVPPQYGQAPPQYQQAPPQYGQTPPQYQQAPPQYQQQVYDYNPVNQGLRKAAFIINLICTIILAFPTFGIALAWGIPMTVVSYRIINDPYKHVALGVCCILFLGLIAGILILCSGGRDKNAY